MKFVLIAIMAALIIGRRSFAESDNQRLQTWKAAIAMFAQNPILGVGPDGFMADLGKEKAGNAHNDILQAAATLGLVGLIAYALFTVHVIRELSGAALGSMVALFVNAKFSPVPLEAMVLAAVIVGGTRSSPGAAQKLAACVLAVLVIPALPIALADFHAKKGELVSLARAAEINPFETSYREQILDLGAFEFNNAKSNKVRSAVYDLIERQKSIVEYRPRDPRAARAYELIDNMVIREN